MACRPGFENDPTEKMRHTAAHVLASAVQELYPGTKVTIGPVIDDGFYYDFDTEHRFTDDDLPKIEAKMTELIKANLEITRQELSRDEAIAHFDQLGESYKVEIIQDLPKDETITLYGHGDWADLCKGPHVAKTGEIKAFKLLSVAGSYWRGDEKRQRLQRIYGTAFGSKAELEDYLARLKEAEARDHRKLGQELDLYSTLDDKGPGLILWHPRGARVRNIIETYWRELHLQEGYDLVNTPHVAHQKLWETSGHLDFYAENMFPEMEMDHMSYRLKPMNCPFHILTYKTRRRSYRELPFRWAELGTVYRYERSGVLHGLMRVRGFTQDDAHIFCRPDQLQDEITQAFRLIVRLLGDFGFDDIQIFLSTRPEKSVGSDDGWESSIAALKGALEGEGVQYEVDEGGGAFYGPKIDIKILDSLKRAWQCSTIQVDFNLPERFQLDYVGSDGEKHPTIMVHRALLGSLERFFGILIEHYGGALPFWLAPEQVRLLTINEKHETYARSCLDALQAKGIRAELDDSSERLGAKIRQGELWKVPYLAIIGDKEAQSGNLSLRSKRKGDLGSMPLEAALALLTEEQVQRST